MTDTYKYGPFGESAALSNTTFGYTGQRYDSETGLYYYKARHYNPAIGRFLQPDPIGYAGGLNLYGYVGNDPLSQVDPLGLAGKPAGSGGPGGGFPNGGGFPDDQAGGDQDGRPPIWYGPISPQADPNWTWYNGGLRKLFPTKEAAARFALEQWVPKTKHIEYAGAIVTAKSYKTGAAGYTYTDGVLGDPATGFAAWMGGTRPANAMGGWHTHPATDPQGNKIISDHFSFGDIETSHLFGLPTYVGWKTGTGVGALKYDPSGRVYPFRHNPLPLAEKLHAYPNNRGDVTPI